MLETTLTLEEQMIRFEHSPYREAVERVLRAWRSGYAGNGIVDSLTKLSNLEIAIRAGTRDFLGYPIRETEEEE